MPYIDGFVAAVPIANREKFEAHAKLTAKVLKEHGATRVVECWGDSVPDGAITSFPKAVQRRDGEAISFSWVVWPSREERDAGMRNVLSDARLNPDVHPLPFDGKRVIYGGFEVLTA